ncbi:MAG: type II CAAX endopeptidase family protein, partial [Planctomycetota bacterium]|nr:type II CAAX endopeptidase family protein [Planctomycetota bacterium]
VLGQLAIVGSLLSFFGSLLVLVWPRLRGIEFHLVWTDLGLHRANPLKELLLGVVVYTMAIPLLVVGLVLSLAIGGALKLVFDYESAPSHPVTEMLGGSALELLMVYLVACVAAPVVEEIAFRGVLYRYLRDVTGRMGFIASFGASALFSSVVFAAIHPQGLVFIPVLSALAVAFCIGREWRGSLISPMVAHALNNAVTITLGTMLLG